MNKEEFQNYLLVLSRLLSEKQLDDVIVNSSDIKLLNAALDVKLALVETEKENTLMFGIDNLMQMDFKLNDGDCICNAMKNTLLLQQNNEEYKKFLTFLNAFIIEKLSKDDSLFFYSLKLISVAIDVALSKSAVNVFLDNSKIIGGVLVDNLNCQDKRATDLLYFKLLPLFLSVCTIRYRNDFLKKVFETENVNVLCALCEYFLPNNANDDNFMVVHYERFWYIIQDCINSNDKLKQKQGLFLLKKAVYIVLENWTNLLPKLPSIARLSTPDTNEILKAWNNYIILLEVIREEHMYLIEPLFSLLHSLQVFDPTWTTCIYHILLSHPNNTLVHIAFQHFLKITDRNNICMFQNIAKLIIPRLTKCFSSEIMKETFECLSKYLVNCDDEAVYSIMLQESLSVTWSPLSLWYFYKCLLLQERIVLAYDIIEGCFTLITLLPHVYIRKGCLKLLVNCIDNASERGRYSFDDRLKIFNLLVDQDLVVHKWDKIINKMMVVDFIKNISKSQDSLVHANVQAIEIAIKLAIYHQIDLYLLNTNFQQLDYLLKNVNLKLLDSLYCNCYKIYTNRMEFLFTYIKYRLENFDSNDIINKDYLQLIYLFVSDVQSIELKFKLNETAMEILLNDDNHFKVQKQVAFSIIASSKTDMCVEQVVDKWKQKFLYINEKIDKNTCLYFLDIYVLHTFNSSKAMTHGILTEMNNILLKMLETQHYEVLPGIFEKILPYILLNARFDIQAVKNTLSKCVCEILQTSKYSVFKKIVNSFLKAIFSNISSMLTDELIEDFLNVCKTLHVLSKTYMFVAVTFVVELKSAILNHKHPIHFQKLTPIIMDFMLLCESNCTLVERNEYEVCQEIYKQLFLDENPNLYDLQVHLGSLEIMQMILRDGNKISAETINNITDNIINDLLKKYLNNYYKKRYFPDSKIHLFKQRIFQILLVLQPYMTTNMSSNVVKVILDSFRDENHQPSVKHLMQWLLIKLLIDYNDEERDTILTDGMDSYSNAKNNSYFIVMAPVIYYVSLWTKENDMHGIFEILLPITMGSQFKSRLYSQMVLYKLYNVACKKKYIKVITDYYFLYTSIKIMLISSDVNTDDILQNDKVFLEDFDPFKYYSLETIYVDFPKLNNVTPMNWENFFDLEIEDFSTIKICNKCRQFFKSIEKKKFSRNVKNTKVNEDNIFCNAQKKIETCSVSEQNCRKSSDFVLVASLIEKATNLGGLSRTCEVFGVKNYIVNNIRIIEDKDFKSLSMTSEKWVDILEVGVDKLKEFLLEKKEKGFEIVAAEQTTSSISLEKFKFKKKTILLLGNEKEGIPPNLLLIADKCIEIPQLGIVRSLNVHVAGALVTWEYNKQHAINNHQYNINNI